jgi:thymidylate synthase (FAD)
MKFVEPSVHLIAHTTLDEFALAEALQALGAPEGWDTDAENGEALVEAMGRLCYKSFDVSMNANLTRVREGNANYVGNIMSSKHGSVFEHASASFMFIDVSPVVTHELVRHRAGTAFSQVSMRFVRLTEIGAYYPKAFEQPFLEQLFKSLGEGHKFQSDEAIALAASERSAQLRDDFEKVVTYLEQMQVHMAEVGLLDHVKDFNLKKRFTSSMRRLAPYGLATSIGVTANHRAWRHMIETRTSRHAEEEIRMVFGDVARALAKTCPNLYQDMNAEHIDGFDEFTFTNSKI